MKWGFPERTNKMKDIRPINLNEAQAIYKFLSESPALAVNPDDLEDFNKSNDPAYFSQYAYCVEEYITGCPGYYGKVYIILWDGSPAAVTTLYLDKDDKFQVGVMSDVDGNAGDGECARI